MCVEGFCNVSTPIRATNAQFHLSRPSVCDLINSRVSLLMSTCATSSGNFTNNRRKCSTPYTLERSTAEFLASSILHSVSVGWRRLSSPVLVTLEPVKQQCAQGLIEVGNHVFQELMCLGTAITESTHRHHQRLNGTSCGSSAE